MNNLIKFFNFIKDIVIASIFITGMFSLLLFMYMSLVVNNIGTTPKDSITSKDFIEHTPFTEDPGEYTGSEDQTTSDVTITKLNSVTTEIYLGPEIGDMQAYTDLLDTLRKAVVGDEIILHMASFGGQVHSGVQIINAMKESKAKVIASIDGDNYSMGSLIVCAADEIKVNSYGYLMFHTYSTSITGKGSMIENYIKNANIEMKDLLVNECVAKHLLTLDQVTDILNGIDIYVYPKEGGGK